MKRRTFVFSVLLPFTAVACGASSSAPATAEPADASPASTAASFTPVDVPLQGTAPFWHAAVTIGGQSFSLSVDTGSSTTVVASASCTSCSGAHLYQTSADAVDEKTPVSGVYDGGDMTWHGNIVEDSIVVGGTSPVRARIGTIASQKNFLDMMASDGILGLGPTRLAAPGTSSVLDALVASGMPNVFAVALCPGSAHLWLGGFDATETTAPIQWAPLLPDTKELPFYNVKVAGLAIDKTPLDVPDATWGTALVDTGGPSFDVPQAALDAVVASLSANGEFTKLFGDPKTYYAQARCVASKATAADVDAVLPPLTLVLGDDASVHVDLPASQSYVLPSSEFGPLANADGWCPGLASISGTPKFDIGSSLLRSLLVVFDRANGRFGVAPRPACH